MLLRTIPVQDGSYSDCENMQILNYFIVPVSTNPQFDRGVARILAQNLWRELRDPTLRNQSFLSKEINGGKTYFAIPCYTEGCCTSQSVAEKFIDTFCKIIEELPIPQETVVAVVLNPFEVSAPPADQSRGGRLSTPVVAQFFAEKFRKANRNIIWFMR